MANYLVKRTGTPVPKRDVEMKSAGSGPVITYRLSPEELEKWRKEDYRPMLTREKYLQLRSEGQTRTQIQKHYFPSNPTKFYSLLKEWGLKEKDAEERELDMMPTQRPIMEPMPTKEEASGNDGASAPINESQNQTKEDGSIPLIQDLKHNIKALAQERNEALAENERLKKELEEKQNMIDELKRKLCTVIQSEQSTLEVIPWPPDDPVDHPAHYTAGKIECIDAIESATVGLTGGQAYATGAAIKYLWRWSRKGGAEDLKKARWYVNRLIEIVERGQQDATEQVRTNTAQ